MEEEKLEVDFIEPKESPAETKTETINFNNMGGQ